MHDKPIMDLICTVHICTFTIFALLYLIEFARVLSIWPWAPAFCCFPQLEPMNHCKVMVKPQNVQCGYRTMPTVTTAVATIIYCRSILLLQIQIQRSYDFISLRHKINFRFSKILSADFLSLSLIFFHSHYNIINGLKR